MPKVESGCRTWLSAALIMLADIGAIGLVIALSVVVRHSFGGQFVFALYGRLWPVLGLFVSTYWLFGLYPGIVFNAVTEIRRIAAATTVVFLMLSVLAFLLRVIDEYSRLVFFSAWVLSMFLVPLARTFVRQRFARKDWWGYPTLVIGAGESGRMLVHTLQTQPELGFRVKALMDAGMPRIAAPSGVRTVRSMDDAAAIARQAAISHAIIALPDVSRPKLLALLESDTATFPHLFIVPNLGAVSSLGIEAQDLCHQLALEVRRNLLMPGAQITKRLIDISLVTLAGVMLLPVLLAVALALKLESRGPVFYRQYRLGRGGRVFGLWKFRSMATDADRILQEHLERHPECAREWEADHKLKNDPRVTRVGRFLRKTSLDELPQLWNVARGEMSLVGPRPIVRDEVPKYGEGFTLYKQVLPGITGLWQVSGRNDTSYIDRVALDSYYVRNWSPWFDVYVLGRTVRAVLAGAGAY
ncbi:MAG: undecaprenyl-phosphate galactose phosphotransferase WbaP [Bryobacterales bacterium]|nr:undecaprenyl-phosphate galactose phosphotransferase WbaP [Bryobacterales bacterium]